jgi:uncharacterized protein (TIGR03382 family)
MRWSGLSLLLIVGVACGPVHEGDCPHTEAELSVEIPIDAFGVVDCTPRGDTGYSAGNPFSIEVVTVDDKPVERETGNAYWVMKEAASIDGVNLTIVSGFRTMAQQEYLYGCYVNCSCNNCNLAATPGYSNHQSGHALDLNTSAPGVLAWLNEHGAYFGFERTVPSEAWHWEWWGGGPGGGICGLTDPECEAEPDLAVCEGELLERCTDGRLEQVACELGCDDGACRTTPGFDEEPEPTPEPEPEPELELVVVAPMVGGPLELPIEKPQPPPSVQPGCSASGGGVAPLALVLLAVLRRRRR